MVGPLTIYLTFLMKTAFPDCSPKAEPNTRIVLVDDHVGLRQMLAFILRVEPRMEVIGEAAGGCEGLKICRELKPDLVVLDLGMEDLAGVYVMRGIRDGNWGTKVLVYTGTENEKMMRSALAGEPDGFVHKSEALDVLRSGLRTVAAGGQYVSPRGKSLLVKKEARAAVLNEKELAVLQMIARGKFTKDIADVMGITLKAVDHHRQHIMDKLGLHDVVSLTRFAMQCGIA